MLHAAAHSLTERQLITSIYGSARTQLCQSGIITLGVQLQACTVHLPVVSNACPGRVFFKCQIV